MEIVWSRPLPRKMEIFAVALIGTWDNTVKLILVQTTVGMVQHVRSMEMDPEDVTVLHLK